jgi:hypothetical protein
MWGGIFGKKNINMKYKKVANDNKISRYATNIFRSDIDRYIGSMTEDYKIILNDGCYYIPHLLESFNNCELITWSKHFKFENPENIPILNTVVQKMAEYFNVTVCQTRLNYYPDNTSWKPFHKDSHKLTNGIKENFTMGASFGSTRELEFKHEQSGNTFKFPQNNGDCFAFTSQVNNIFLHGVPKINKIIRPRFSIIAWGYKKI